MGFLEACFERVSPPLPPSPPKKKATSVLSNTGRPCDVTEESLAFQDKAASEARSCGTNESLIRCDKIELYDGVSIGSRGGLGGS